MLGGGADGRITLVLPLPNIADGYRTFIADPFEQFCAQRRLEAEDLQLLAIYHSHPEGGLDPSHEDLVYATRWSCAHLIVAVSTVGQSRERFRAFRCTRTGSISEVEIRLQ